MATRDEIEKILGGLSAKEVAELRELEYDENEDAVIVPGWVADDGNQEVEFPYAESGLAAAREYVEDGDWGESEDGASTSWVTVHVWRIGLKVDEDGEIEEVEIDRDSHKVEIEPEEPDCVGDSDHDWQAPLRLVGGIEENPGVWSSGGGVILHRLCVRCGCGKSTDTWAQDPADGTQGLTSVSYEPGQYLDEIQEHLRSLDVGDLDQESIADSGGDEAGDWTVFLAKGPWGWWAAVSVTGTDAADTDVEWFPSEEEARETAQRHVENLQIEVD